jgi:hypothetical protein
LVLPLQRALGKPVQPVTDAYKRFTGDYLIQKCVTVISLSVIVFISILGTAKKQIVEANRPSRVYVPEEKAPPPSPERQDGYVMNDNEKPIPFGTTYRADQRSGVPRQEERPADYSTAGAMPPGYKTTDTDEETEIGQSKPAQQLSSNTKKTVVKPAVKPVTVAKSLCERVKSAGGWYIQDNLFSAAANAQERVKLLRSKNIQCDALNTACLGEEGWVVRLGYNQYSETAARTKATEYAKAIAKAGLKTGKTLIKKVE